MGPKMKCAAFIITYVYALAVAGATIGVCHLISQITQNDPMPKLGKLEADADCAVNKTTDPDCLVVSSIGRLATQSAWQQVLMSISASLAVVSFLGTLLVVTLFPGYVKYLVRLQSKNQPA
ncbi:uncharacterized protein LOC135943569 [Cloeon dipterum]|uniref:uncharacterized protein LOC135943569 n=1 Tax=Cloeon dipterum TaxID=197152 RepID=UPI00321F6AFD